MACKSLLRIFPLALGLTRIGVNAAGGHMGPDPPFLTYRGIGVTTLRQEEAVASSRFLDF